MRKVSASSGLKLKVINMPRYRIVKSDKWIDIVLDGISVCTFRRDLFPNVMEEAISMVNKLNGES